MKTDLRKLQRNYFNASMSNAANANDAMTHLQTGLLTIILAELAFIGISDLSSEEPSLIGAISVTLLLVSAFSFVLGSHTQWRHVLKTARNYSKLSNEVTEYMKSTGADEVDKVPEVLKDENSEISTDKVANWYFLSSIFGTLIATILILVRLFGAIV